MAGGTLADVKVALTDYFAPRLVRQINRTAMMLNLLPVKPADTGQGQAITWGIKTSGAVGQAVADGGAAPTANFDKRLKASLVYGDYQSQVTETGQAIAAADHSVTPGELIDLIGGDVEDSGDAIASQVNKDFWVQNSTGGGVLPITSFASAVALTGTYAGVDKAANPLWQGGALLANGGVPRALTLDLIRQGRRGVRTNGGAVDLYVCDLTTFDRYGALIDPQRRYVDTVRTAKGEVKLDAGYKALEFEGAAFIGDKDAPAGTLVGLTTKWCEWRYLPKDQDLAGIMAQVASGQYEENAESFPAGLPVSVLPLARTADAENFLVVVYPQFVCRRPNQQFMISDIA
jgi:hypothetical protein